MAVLGLRRMKTSCGILPAAAGSKNILPSSIRYSSRRSDECHFIPVLDRIKGPMGKWTAGLLCFFCMTSSLPIKSDQQKGLVME